jgi:hypothetical protein
VGRELLDLDLFLDLNAVSKEEKQHARTLVLEEVLAQIEKAGFTKASFRKEVRRSGRAYALFIDSAFAQLILRLPKKGDSP